MKKITLLITLLFVMTQINFAQEDPYIWLEDVDAEWVPLRPNTDVAMMLGLAHTLQIEGLTDQAFLDRYTQGFEAFLPYLMGEPDGIAKTADWAAKICEIPAETIRALARRMAAQRTMISLS